MRYVDMHLYPRELPEWLHVEVATAVSATSGGKVRPAAVSPRQRPSALDPIFRGGALVDVLLDACAVPRSYGAPSCQVDVRVGDWSWSALALGQRTARCAGGRFTMSAPAPITAPVRISFGTAYGGGESGEPCAPRPSMKELTSGRAYPRNPFGRGYRCGTADGAWELPQLEDETDLLTAERLERIAAGDWACAPLPWCLDEVHAVTFPRCTLLPGLGPDVAGQGEVAETTRGYLRERRTDPEPAVDTRFLQDAPPWAWLAGLGAGTDIEVRGCLAMGQPLALAMPGSPAFSATIDGRDVDLDLRPARLVIRPQHDELVVHWCGDVVLPRPFLPGVHKRIPISVRIHGCDSVPYPTPPVAPRPRFRH